MAPQFSQAAEENLSKAVKLEPGLVEAWNTLGEQYWKKGDLIAAKTCFTGALQQVCVRENMYEGKILCKSVYKLHSVNIIFNFTKSNMNVYP